MFSSNQKFSVSCTEKQLKDVLALALSMRLEHHKNPTLAYQFTDNGKFVIGWCGNEPKKGWTKFPFDRPTDDLLIAMAKQFISTASPLHRAYLDEEDFGDGSTHPGYIVEAVKETFADVWEGIQNPFYGIVSIRAFNCYYSK